MITTNQDATVPDAAVEAGARALFDHTPVWHIVQDRTALWSEVAEHAKERYRAEARAALTAAAPFIVAQAKAEALREASEDLDPDLGVVDYYEEPQVNRIVSKCRDWLDARAATIEGATP